jgi:hypothetical protein
MKLGRSAGKVPVVGALWTIEYQINAVTVCPNRNDIKILRQVNKDALASLKRLFAMSYDIIRDEQMGESSK